MPYGWPFQRPHFAGRIGFWWPILTAPVTSPALIRMKPLLAFLAMLLLAISGSAQNPAPKPETRATLEGSVVKDPGSEPVKKALVELIAENQQEGGDYTATTGAEGAFRIEGIIPGRYRLFVERTGLLETDKRHGRSEGRMLTLSSGQELKDVQVRLQAAAVVRGRVTDEDGDPMAEAQIAVLRQTYIAGHSRLEQIAADRTNDLGEYRVANLAAGNYFVSVSPPPDFKTLIAAQGAGGDARETPDKPATTYQTTYYPGTTDRSQAAPVQLHAGDEFPANFALTPAPALSIRGSVVNLPPRATASIMLQSRDFGLVFNGTEMHKDGTFIIRDVAPGSYTLLATVDNSPVPLTARQALQLVSSSIDGLRLAPQPGAVVRGRLRLEGKGQLDAGQILIALQPTDHAEDSGSSAMADVFSSLAHVSSDGSFEWRDVPPGNYSVQLVGQGTAGQDYFVKSIFGGGRQDDMSVNVGGGTIALEVVASANGGVLEGVATNAKGEPVPNAVVIAAPEAMQRGRIDRYRKTVSDQTGHFLLRAIAPGDYTLFAWESVEGEAYYDPDFLARYEAQGSSLRVAEGDRKAVQPVVIPDPEDQP